MANWVVSPSQNKSSPLLTIVLGGPMSISRILVAVCPSQPPVLDMVKEYVPAIAEVAAPKLGAASVELKPFGPVHL